MNLTTGIREQVRRWMPLEDLLPDHLPAFVRSPTYFFDVISLSSLVLLILTGILLASFGNVVFGMRTARSPSLAWFSV